MYAHMNVNNSRVSFLNLHFIRHPRPVPGPGISLGTSNDDFAWAVFGAGGGHFTIAEHMLFSVDAGPMLTHTKNNTNLRIRGIGSLLGASVHFIF